MPYITKRAKDAPVPLGTPSKRITTNASVIVANQMPNVNNCFRPRENPIIANTERTGYPDGKEPQYPICPICGAECETIYQDRYGAYAGCDVCMKTKDAWEVEDCFPGKEP